MPALVCWDEEEEEEDEDKDGHINLCLSRYLLRERGGNAEKFSNVPFPFCSLQVQGTTATSKGTQGNGALAQRGMSWLCCKKRSLNPNLKPRALYCSAT